MTVNEVDEATTAERPRDDGQVTKIGTAMRSSRAGRSQTRMTDSQTRGTATKRRRPEKRPMGKAQKGDSKRSLKGPRPIYIKAPKARRAITSRPAANRSRSANKQVKTRNVVHMRRGTRTRSPGQRALGAGQENQETGAGEPRRGSGAQNVGRGRGSRLPFANLGA